MFGPTVLLILTEALVRTGVLEALVGRVLDVAELSPALAILMLLLIANNLFRLRQYDTCGNYSKLSPNDVFLYRRLCSMNSRPPDYYEVEPFASDLLIC